MNKRDILVNCALALTTIGGGGVFSALALASDGLSAEMLQVSSGIIAIGITMLITLFFTTPKLAKKHVKAKQSTSVKLDNSTIRIGRLNSTADVAFDAKNSSSASAGHVNHKPKDRNE